jgi:UDP-N-acetylmuramate dehydrogenase
MRLKSSFPRPTLTHQVNLVLARQAAALGRSGLEWMVGVPGSVGGAVRMNAGGHGSTVSASLIDVHLLRGGPGERRTVVAADLDLTYRHSNLSDRDIVLSARFSLSERDPVDAEAELSEIVRWRREHQPGGANCGSVFTNPVGDSAGRLIDAAGLRGLRLGTASVSEKHANFIQADDNARATDIWALIIEVRRRVYETFGVELQPEVRTAGFDADLPNLSSTSPGGPHPILDVT